MARKNEDRRIKAVLAVLIGIAIALLVVTNYRLCVLLEQEKFIEVPEIYEADQDGRDRDLYFAEASSPREEGSCA